MSFQPAAPSKLSLRPPPSPYHWRFTPVHAPKYDLDPDGYKPIKKYRKSEKVKRDQSDPVSCDIATSIARDINFLDALDLLVQMTVRVDPRDSSGKQRRYVVTPEKSASAISWENILSSVPRKKIPLVERASPVKSPRTKFASDSDEESNLHFENN